MFGILIDKDGYKIDFDTLFNLEEKVLKDGGQIVEQDWNIANGMNKAKWDGGGWIDTDPLPEPEPIVPEPTEMDLLRQDNLILNEAVTEMTMLISMILEGGM